MAKNTARTKQTPIHKLVETALTDYFKSSYLSKLSGLAIIALFLSYPGQNTYQTLTTRVTDHRLVPVSTWSPPQAATKTNPPSLQSYSAYVFEPKSGTILYSHNQDTRLMPASTTKIMTALVALNTYTLDQTLTVKTGDEAIGHSVNLGKNQSFTVKDLLYALLVSSGNDAALTLAENHPEGYRGFVTEMNRLAKELNLSNTSFTNVSGIEDFNHMSTVRDLAILTKHALQNPFIQDIVATPETVISDTTQTFTYNLETTNKLLGKVEGVLGVKTGWTEHAGECLVTYTNRAGKEIITVVLSSADRFGDSEKLIEWTYDNYFWQ